MHWVTGARSCPARLSALVVAAAVVILTLGLPGPMAAPANAAAVAQPPRIAAALASRSAAALASRSVASVHRFAHPRWLGASVIGALRARHAIAAQLGEPAGLSGPAPACYGDNRSMTPVGGDLDPSSFGAYYNCSEDEWTFEVGTAAAFSEGTFGGWDVVIDTDGDLEDDCDGAEYGVAMVQTSPRLIQAGVFSFDSACDVTLVASADAVLTSDGVAVTFAGTAIGDANTIVWDGELDTYTELQDNDAGDVVPAAGFVEYPVEGAVTESVPPDQPVSCDTPAGDAAQVVTTTDDPRAAAVLRTAGLAGVHDYGEGIVAFDGSGDAARRALTAAGLRSVVSPQREYTTESLAAPGTGTTTPPDDPGYPSQWNLQAVDATGAWSVATGNHVVVADIDTGVDFTNSDLPKPQLVAGIDETQSKPTPIDYSSGDTDTDGHGTAVAGVIAAATDNDVGLASLGWNTRVMPVKASTDGTFTSAATAAGIKWAANHGARVVNLSLGGPCPDPAVQSAIEYAQDNGVLVVAAAGNGALDEDLDSEDGYDDSPTYPAAYAGVLAVGATGFDGYRAAYSNTGSYVSLVAPGGDLDGDDDGIPVLEPGTVDTTAEVGTSFAAPQVAAAAALVLSVNSKLTASQVSELLTGTATDLGPTGADEEYGAGILDAGAALADTPPTSKGFGTFTTLAPSRILDTRIGLGAAEAPVQGGSSINLTVDGVGGIPASGVAAVVLNVTVADPTAGGYVTVWPAGQTRPNASNINFEAGQALPNLVTVKVGADGRVSLYNSGGSVQLVADVAGYYGDGTGPPGSTFVPVSPVRLLDTRATGSAPGPGQSVSLQVAGSSVSGVPATATAVVLNVTAVKPTGGGYLTAYPEGTARPVVSNLNFSAGEVVANLVTVELGPDGGVSFYNSGGVTQVVVDLAGYFTAAGDTSGSRFVPLVDYRVLDTRHDIGGYSAPVTGGRPIVVQVTGEGGVIDGATAVVLNTTVTGPTAPGYLTVYPGGESVPVASNLNFPAGATLANLVTCELGAGQVEVYASGGTVNAIADVEGWYEPAGS